MTNKRIFALLTSVLCFSVITFNMTENTYANHSNKTSTKTVAVYKNYIDNLSEMAEKTGLVDFSWMDVEKINTNDFHLICDEISEMSKKSKETIKILVGYKDKDINEALGKKDEFEWPEGSENEYKNKLGKGDNFKYLIKLVKGNKKIELISVPEYLRNNDHSYNEFECLRLAFRSAQKSGVLNILGLDLDIVKGEIEKTDSDKEGMDEIIKERSRSISSFCNEDVLKACISRLRLRMGDRKLKIIYSKEMEKSNEMKECLKFAKECDFETYCVKSIVLSKKIQAAVNLAYETQTINLLNICKDPNNLGKGELQILLGGIKEFAERYNFDNKKINVLIGYNFNKFYDEIKSLCDKYEGKFNLIKESDFLKKTDRGYSLDAKDNTAVKKYIDGITSKHIDSFRFILSQTKNLNIFDSTSYLAPINYNEMEQDMIYDLLQELSKEVGKKAKSIVEIVYTDSQGNEVNPFGGSVTLSRLNSLDFNGDDRPKRAFVLLDNKQTLAKKLNTAYITNCVVINPEDNKEYSNGHVQVWNVSQYEPPILVASKICQKFFQGKKVKDLTVYVNFDGSPEDERAKKNLEKLNVNVKSFDRVVYKDVTKRIKNAEVTGVLDFADDKFNDIEKGGNFDMAVACIVNFLQDNLSRDIKLIIGSKTKDDISDKLNALKKAYSKLSVDRLQK